MSIEKIIERLKGLTRDIDCESVFVSYHDNAVVGAFVSICAHKHGQSRTGYVIVDKDYQASARLSIYKLKREMRAIERRYQHNLGRATA